MEKMADNAMLPFRIEGALGMGMNERDQNPCQSGRDEEQDKNATGHSKQHGTIVACSRNVST